MASHFKNDLYLEYLARVLSELAGPQSQWYLTAVSTKHGGYQPLSGWYQLDKVNINKFPVRCCHLNRQHQTDRTSSPTFELTEVSTNHGGYQLLVGTN